MENKTLQTEGNNNPKSKIKYIIIVAVALIAAISAYYYYTHKRSQHSTRDTVNKEAISRKNDSLRSQREEYEEEGEERYGTNIYVGNGDVLGGNELRFGDVLYVDYQKSNENRKTVYLSNPYESNNPTPYKINADILIDESSFESYKENFSLSPFTSLPHAVKSLILDNHYSDGNDYNITQNADRAKSTICYGDFDNDGSGDFAVLLDNNEKQISRLLIICTNSATKKPYIGFAENYNDKMRISSFKYGTSIIMDSELQTSKADGVFLKGEDLEIAIVYEKRLQKFKTYYQE